MKFSWACRLIALTNKWCKIRAHFSLHWNSWAGVMELTVNTRIGPNTALLFLRVSDWLCSLFWKISNEKSGERSFQVYFGLVWTCFGPIWVLRGSFARIISRSVDFEDWWKPKQYTTAQYVYPDHSNPCPYFHLPSTSACFVLFLQIHHM